MQYHCPASPAFFFLCGLNIPLYGYIFCLLSHLLMDIGLFLLWLRTFVCKFCGNECFNWSGIAGLQCLLFDELNKLFSKVTLPLCIPIIREGMFQYCRIFDNLPTTPEGLLCVLLMSKDLKHVHMVLDHL